MSDAPLTRPLEWPDTEAGLTAAHVEEACETILRGNTHRNEVISSLNVLRRLALRGLEAERVREETLEEAAKKIERMLAPEDEACRENATLKLSIAAIRALKKGTSDANPR